MGKINSTVDKVTNSLVREVAKSHKNGVIRTWKNRKVISVEKWKEFPISTETEIKLQYLPEEYVDWPWPFHPQSKQEESQIEQWFFDWFEYLYEKKKPGYGEYVCRKCILHHDSGKYYESIRDLVLPRTVVKYPCSTENIFKCPFLPKGPSKSLFELKKIMDLVIDSLSHANSLSTYNKHTIIGYFDRNFCVEYSDPMHIKPSGGGPLYSTLENFKISDMMVDSIQDVYNVLTDENLLGEVIDQHIRDTRNHFPESKVAEAEELEKIKAKAIGYFGEIRDEIKIEDICDFHGRNLEEEKEHVEMCKNLYMPKGDELDLEYVPRSGLCIKCAGFGACAYHAI